MSESSNVPINEDFAAVNAQERGCLSKSFPRILLIIPCYNEEHSIGGLLLEIQAVARHHDTVVIDDCSTDRTAAVAEPMSTVLRLSSNLGIGGAVQTGIKFAYQNGYDLCVQIDGDGQHNPAEIELLLASWHQKGCNIIIGSRYLEGRGFKSTLSRRLGSNLISWSIRALFGGERITDPTSGMRMMDRSAMEVFSKQYPQDFPEPISLAFALRIGLAICEAPVKMRSRMAGTSSISGLKPLTYMIRVLSYIVLTRLETRR